MVGVAATRADAENASHAGRRVAKNTESAKEELHWPVAQILSSRNVRKNSRALKKGRTRQLAKSAARHKRIPAGEVPPSRRWIPPISVCPLWKNLPKRQPNLERVAARPLVTCRKCPVCKYLRRKPSPIVAQLSLHNSRYPT